MKNFPRLTLIPSFMVISAAIAYVLILIMQRIFYHSFNPVVAPEEFDSHKYCSLILFIFAVSAGTIRASRFQLVFNKNYTRWLAATPWQASKSLPLGPLHLVWQDFLLLAVLYALDRFHLHNEGLVPVLLFLLAYLLVSLIALIRMQLRIIPRLFVAVLPLAFFLVNNYPLLLLLLAMEYVLVFVGFRVALPHFPWKLLDTPQPSPAGWPFDALGAVNPKPLVPVLSALYYSALSAWWIFSITVLIHDTNFANHSASDAPNVALFAVLGIVIALLRTVAYAHVLMSGTSIFGRIASGRLFIPTYDRIFVGPIAVLAATALSAKLLLFFGITPLTAAIATFLIVAPALLTGPSLGVQKLTGGHRLRQPPKTQSPRINANASIKIQLHRDQFKAF